MGLELPRRSRYQNLLGNITSVTQKSPREAWLGFFRTFAEFLACPPVVFQRGGNDQLPPVYQEPSLPSHLQDVDVPGAAAEMDQR